jgi:hypothetical protein
MNLTITFTETEVALLLGAITPTIKAAQETPIPDDPTAAAETKANIAEMVKNLTALQTKIWTATGWSD